MKKFIASILTFALIMSLSMPVFATQNESNNDITIDGITYTIQESYIDGKKIVDVIEEGGTTTTTVLDGDQLTVYTANDMVSLSLNEVQAEASLLSEGYDNGESLYWGYYYFYSDAEFDEYGMYFNLKSGNDTENIYGYDRNNTVQRDIGYNFCSAVRQLITAQSVATAACGAAAGSIAAAIWTAAPTGGIGAIIGTVSAILGGTASIAEWVNAWNISRDCNQIFLQYKQAL